MKNRQNTIHQTNHRNNANNANYMSLQRKILAVAVAFAMVVTLLPSAVVCADDRSIEPTQTAAEMTQSGTDDTQEKPGSTEATDPSETTDESSASETETESTAETTTTTAAPTTTRATTTVNTSGKRWVTPKGNKSLSLTLCRNTDGTVFDLTSQAGQKLYDYDTLQGAAAGKGYGYFTLYNRDNNYVKIVKVKLSEMSVVKVSGPLDIKHANGITYNGRNNTIVVADSTPVPKRISVIDANTLTLRYHKTLKMPGKVKGMSKKQRRKFKGVGAIAYNEQRNCYICLMRKTHDLLFLNASFKPTKRVKQKSRISGLLYQSLDTYKDCIMVCQSFKGKKNYNAVTVYNMKGKKIARFTMGAGVPQLELEAVFHDGNQFYAGFYSNYGARADYEKLHVKRQNRIFRINNL